MIPNLQKILACQKTFLDIFNNSLTDNFDFGLLVNNNFIDGKIDINTKIKSNLEKNMTYNIKNNFCKYNFITNIKEFL